MAAGDGGRAAVRVYVSGPYSADPERCTSEAITVADRLLRLGLAPLVPHLKNYWAARHPHGYEEWISIDLAWVAAADVLLRTPGADMTARGRRPGPPSTREIWVQCLRHCCLVALAALAGAGLIVLSEFWPTAAGAVILHIP